MNYVEFHVDFHVELLAESENRKTNMNGWPDVHTHEHDFMRPSTQKAPSGQLYSAVTVVKQKEPPSRK